MSAKLAKISQPHIGQAYPRHHLFSMLDQAADRGITWIGAGAGTGKTVLIASYLGARAIPCLWYRIDPRDADTATFFYYLREAGRQAGLPGTDALPLLTGEYIGAEVAFGRNFFSQLFGGAPDHYTVVFDNYQDLPNEAPLHQILPAALQEIPPEGRAFILSRTAPPPEIVRLQANQAMSVIDATGMQLNRMEISGLVDQNRDVTLPEEVIDDIYLETDGWAAGVILMLEHFTRHGAQGWRAKRESRDAMFNYFATELYAGAPQEMRGFLLGTAMVPHFDADTARELTSSEDVKMQVSELICKNFFIYTQDTPELTYQYHALFREFLQSQAQREWGLEEYGQARRNAAQVLMRHGWLEEAAEIMYQCDDADALAGLALDQAPQLVAQGRYRTLQRWIDSLGKERIDSQPWLTFWLASSRAPFDMLAARGLYENVYATFRSSGDILGALMAWYGIVQTYFYHWGSYVPLDHWIGEFDNLTPEIPRDLPDDIEWRIAAGMFACLLWRQPGHAELGTWRERLEHLVTQGDNIERRQDLASKLVTYYVWMGHKEPAARLVASVSKQIHRATPLSAINWLSLEIFFHNSLADFDAAMNATTLAMSLIEKHGIIGMTPLVLAQHVQVMLSQGKFNEAGAYFGQLERMIPPDAVLHQAHFHWIASWRDYLGGEMAEALRHMRIAVKRTAECGAPVPYAMTLTTLAYVLNHQGYTEEAERRLDEAVKVIGKMGSQHIAVMVALVRTEIAMARDEEVVALGSLRTAFTLASKIHYVNDTWWIPASMARLCAMALRHDIEPEFVRMLIRKRGLVPVLPLDLESWPWPVKIYTLGRFTMLINDATPKFGRKSQRRPLELMQALIALGGRGVAENRLAEALWPDAEGDASRHNLQTTLYRLRKLLGDDKAIQMSQGALTLDSRYCWVDVWALERALGSVAQAPCGQLASLATRITTLYQDHFLNRESEAPWAMAARERLRSRAQAGLLALGTRLYDAGKSDLALSVYEKGLEIDEFNDEFYRRLIICHALDGRKVMALSIYDRLKDRIGRTFSTSPSAELSTLAATISGGDLNTIAEHLRALLS